MSDYDKARSEAIKRFIAKYPEEYTKIWEEVKKEFGIVTKIRTLNPNATTNNAARRQLRLNHPERFKELYEIEKTKLYPPVAYGRALSLLAFEFSKEYREIYDHYAAKKKD